MRRRSQEIESDTLSLSFLDLISCGLGGAIFLSLVFSIVRQDKPAPLISQHFLDVTVTSSDQDAVLNFLVQAPAGPPLFIPLTEFDIVTGQVPSKHPLRQWGSPMLLGFSPYGGENRVLTREGQYYKLLVHDPKPGTWTVEVVYRDRRNWNNVGANISKVEVRRSVITSLGSQGEPQSQQIGFGHEFSSFGRDQPIIVDNPRFGANRKKS